MISLRSVTKSYESGETSNVVLRQVSLDIPDGDFVAIMGPSGSGKSTLLTIVGAINPPSSGDVLIDGMDVYDLKGDALANFRRENIGFVFQELHLISYLTAGENVMVPLAVANVETSSAQLALHALRSVGMETKASRLPDQLSGGEKGRVAIARALVNHPRILLADEPTGNLDSRTGEEIMRLLSVLNSQGHTIVMVTHNANSARFAKRIIYLKDGVIVDEEENENRDQDVSNALVSTEEPVEMEDDEEDENELIVIGLVVLVAGLILAFVLFGLQIDHEFLHAH